MKVSVILKGRTDQYGRRYLFIRINEGEKRSYKATDIKLLPNQFEKGKVKNHPDQAQLNRKILNLIVETEAHGFIQYEKAPTFNDYCISLFNQWDKTKHPDTIRRYQSAMQKFNDFAPGILLPHITGEILQGFQAYCYAIGNKSNTVWGTFSFLRVVIRRAVREGKITSNPFNLFEMPKYKDPKKIFLTEAQIKAVDKVRTDKKVPREIIFAATWFLIGCYTGLRFGDMQAFDKKMNVKNGRLIVYTSKTGEVVGMPIGKKLEGLFISIEYKPLAITNEYYNRLLKQVQGLAGIDETMTAHLSRHTAAVRWANAGISIEVVAKLLGHSSVRTAAIYYKITSKRIDDELRKVK